jgi:hypothetical protein
MLEMTGLRDHHLLDLSILSAVSQMADAQQARMLEIFVDGTHTMLRLRGWANKTEVKMLQEAFDDEMQMESIAAYPALAKCLRAQKGREKFQPKG